MNKLIQSKAFIFTTLKLLVILIGLIYFIRLASLPDRYNLTIENVPNHTTHLYIIGKNGENFYPLSYYYPFMHFWAELPPEGLSGKTQRDNNIISMKWPDNVSLDSILIKVKDDEWLEYKLNENNFPTNHIPIFRLGGHKIYIDLNKLNKAIVNNEYAKTRGIDNLSKVEETIVTKPTDP